MSAGITFKTKTEEDVFNRVWSELPELVAKKCNGYDEVYGYKLVPDDPDASEKFYDEAIARALIYKYCVAYQFDHDTIVSKIISILNWRKEFNPLSCAFREVHDPSLTEVGMLTEYSQPDSPSKLVITWNIYGKLLENKVALFKDINKFLRFRIGLMERGVRLLNFLGDDAGQEKSTYMSQVHDYEGVTLRNMDSSIRKAAKEIVKVFQSYYPEILHAKYFVNVPTVLGWVYDVFKAFVDPRTRKKFVVMSDPSKLGRFIPEAPAKPYGGNDTKHSLADQNLTDIRPTPYALYLLEQQVIEDVD